MERELTDPRLELAAAGANASRRASSIDSGERVEFRLEVSVLHGEHRLARFRSCSPGRRSAASRALLAELASWP